ncbi:MAG: hypothetical protein K5881_11320 [Saccharofermentans sp.]|nr:hypothetical protein [Saccharofermentans sp.]
MPRPFSFRRIEQLPVYRSFSTDDKVSHEVADKIRSWIEAHPSEELVTSTESRTLKMGDETIKLTLADGPRGQFLDGSWHARSALMANADKVQELAKKLPYMQFLK